MGTIGTLSATSMLILGLFLIVLGVLWTILPFAIFGIKPRLDVISAELRALRNDFAAWQTYQRRKAGDDPLCGECGAVLEPTGKFCGSCGTAVPQ